MQCTAAGFASSLVFSHSLQTFFHCLPRYSHNGAMAGANDVAINAHAVGVEKQLGAPTMSRFHAMFSLGGIIGSIAGGWIAAGGIRPPRPFDDCLDNYPVRHLIARRLMSDTSEAPNQGAHFRFNRPPAALLALERDRAFASSLSEGAIADWTAVYLREILNAGEGTAAAGYAAFSAAMTIFRFTGDAITVRLGRAWTTSRRPCRGCWPCCGRGGHLPGMGTHRVRGCGSRVLVDHPRSLCRRRPRVLGNRSGWRSDGERNRLSRVPGRPTRNRLHLPERPHCAGGLFLLVVLCAAAALLVSVVQRGARDGDNPLRVTQ